MLAKESLMDGIAQQWLVQKRTEAVASPALCVFRTFFRLWLLGNKEAIESPSGNRRCSARNRVHGFYCEPLATRR